MQIACVLALKRRHKQRRVIWKKHELGGPDVNSSFIENEYRIWSEGKCHTSYTRKILPTENVRARKGSSTFIEINVASITKNMYSSPYHLWSPLLCIIILI